MKEKQQEQNNLPQLEVNYDFYNRVHGYYHVDFNLKDCDMATSSDYFEYGARYAIAHLKELVTPASLQAFIQACNEQDPKRSEYRAYLIEKLAVYAFDKYGVEGTSDILPDIANFVDNILKEQKGFIPYQNPNSIILN